VITSVAGIRVGHWTDPVGLTGCTVVLPPPGTVASCEVRGGAPGTRETDLLRPGMLVQEAHAVLLTGGSAFGLAAADGVMRYLAERGIGFETPVARVPIVATPRASPPRRARSTRAMSAPAPARRWRSSGVREAP
jgi:L-aminopeptidase/D-esterase-like protein